MDIRLLFAAVLKSNAVGLIIAHNHPAGKTAPSEADKGITRKIKAAGELMEIRLLDHLIVTAEAYYSFADEGVLQRLFLYLLFSVLYHSWNTVRLYEDAVSLASLNCLKFVFILVMVL